MHSNLQKVWRECLSEEEKFEFWFTHFNAMERVRLWNQLVFTREWFRRVVTFSRRQTKYLEAVKKQEKLQIEEQRNEAKKKAAEEKEKAAAKKEEDKNADEENPLQQDNKDKEVVTFYKGFHRRDLNEMLKQYAQLMYQRGLRNQELLIIKINQEHTQEVI